jgi:hypothetical protein
MTHYQNSVRSVARKALQALWRLGLTALNEIKHCGIHRRPALMWQRCLAIGNAPSSGASRKVTAAIGKRVKIFRCAGRAPPPIGGGAAAEVREAFIGTAVDDQNSRD